MPSVARNSLPPRTWPKGRVCALFGAHGAGTTTVAQCLRDASACELAILPADAEGSQLAQARRYVDVLLLDGVLTADDVQRLVVERLVDGANPWDLIVQVRADQPTGDTLWAPRCAAIERSIQLYSLPYYTIHNVHDTTGDGLYSAVAQLAMVLRLRK